MKQHKVISLALSFASFLVARMKVNGIILFGSVATNTFDEESDIDLFIETDKEDVSKIQTMLELYKKTKEYEAFRLEGVKNEIAVKCGKLKEWKGLQRSMISQGIVLYGVYKEQPEKLQQKVLVILNTNSLARAVKVKIWRKIYGYKQKVGKKIYNMKGLAEEKLGKGVFMVSKEQAQTVMHYLRKNKVKHSFFAIWVE